MIIKKIKIYFLILKYLISKTNSYTSNLLLRRIIFEIHEYGSKDTLKYCLVVFLKRFANYFARKKRIFSQIKSMNKNILKVKQKNMVYEERYSLSGQDLFVKYLIDNNSSKNYYVEVGAGWPIKINNTYLLEHKHKWHGLSIDFDQKMVDDFNRIRKNRCLFLDATKIDYADLFISSLIPNEIDYLSLDIDPAYQTLLVLALMPFETHKFKIITFEHDSYRNGSLIRIVSRLFLRSYGYLCVYKNVNAIGFGNYEDWWIHPEYISQISARDAVLRVKNLIN